MNAFVGIAVLSLFRRGLLACQGDAQAPLTAGIWEMLECTAAALPMRFTCFHEVVENWVSVSCGCCDRLPQTRWLKKEVV